MKCDNATKSNRKSGVAQWRDLQFRGPVLEMFFGTATISRSEQGERIGPKLIPTVDSLSRKAKHE